MKIEVYVPRSGLRSSLSKAGGLMEVSMKPGQYQFRMQGNSVTASQLLRQLEAVTELLSHCARSGLRADQFARFGVVQAVEEQV
jgi:hypothetical protein